MHLHTLPLLFLLTPSDSSFPSFPLTAGKVGTRMVTVDSEGHRVKLACVNWYGAHMEDMVVNGLDRQPLTNIVSRIVELGFNCVRLTFALDTIYLNPVVKAERVSMNPLLEGMRVMEVLDQVVEELSRQQVIVLLNNHISTAQWCCPSGVCNVLCSVSTYYRACVAEGLWYTDEYPEDAWLAAWQHMAQRSHTLQSNNNTIHYWN